MIGSLASLDTSYRFTRKQASSDVNKVYNQLEVKELSMRWLANPKRDSPILLRHCVYVDWGIDPGVRTSRAVNRQLTRLSTCDTGRIMPSTSSLEHLQIFPLPEASENGLITTLIERVQLRKVGVESNEMWDALEPESSPCYLLIVPDWYICHRSHISIARSECVAFPWP